MTYEKLKKYKNKKLPSTSDKDKLKDITKHDKTKYQKNGTKENIEVKKTDVEKTDVEKTDVEKSKHNIFNNTHSVPGIFDYYLAYNSFKDNAIFWLTLFTCTIIISHYSKNSCYISGICTLFITMYMGWEIHRFIHANNLTNIYKTIDDPFINYIRNKCPILNYCVLTFTWYSDFHDVIHHDSTINKEWKNLLIEFIENIFAEGGVLIMLTLITNFSISLYNRNFSLNKGVLLLWALLYATVHNINYNISPSKQHILHHKEPQTNYGIDLIDIIFNTKCDKDSYEVNNVAAINIIIISAFIVYFRIFLD